MNKSCKRLILDKNVFLGTSTDKLCQFAKSHFLILPEVLAYECATTQEEEKQLLLERFTNTIRAGAYVCPSIGMISEREQQDRCPYGNIEDENETEKIKKALGIRWAEERIENVKDKEMQRTKEFYTQAKEIAQRIKLIGESKTLKPYVKAAGKKSQQDKQYLYKNYAQAVDSCLKIKTEISEDYVYWHYLRLMLFYMLVFSNRLNTQIENLERHCQDMTYVVLLCRADGLLTNDNTLTEIATAAFPQKNIFNAIEKVPKNYICNSRVSD
ncbi:MAG: hypothetical protein WC374_05460 [Phycisphaerae bacterium]|jgi:hypothetical protein